MRRPLVALALLLAACSGAHGPPPAPVPPGEARFDWFSYSGDDSVYRALRAGPGEYLNPVLPGFYPDPSIVRVGDDYYLVTSSFAWYPGVPIFHSPDLVHWTQLGHVLDRPGQLALDSAGISRGIFAPTIRYHAGTFYMITTLVDRGGNFYVTARDPAGPWSDPVWLPEIDGIDPSFFFDDSATGANGGTGRAYVVNNGPPIGPPLYPGHRALWLQEFDVAAGKLVGPRRVIVNGGVDITKKPIWIEGPHIFRANGRYYLIAAEGGTGDQHSEVVFRSDSIWGPWQPDPDNPILTQRDLAPGRPFPVTSTGHADFVETPAGEWWAVFLGARPYADDLYNTGRETFMLRVRWDDDWPVILAHGQAVPYARPRPHLTPQPPGPLATSGNFTVRDDFSEPTLPPYWNVMRTPRGAPWYDLTSHPGWLTLRARPEALGGRGQPSFVGRRQQHATASASTAMAFTPARPGDFAGLAAFQNETHWFALGVGLDQGKAVVQLLRKTGGAGATPGDLLAATPVTLRPGAPVYLRIDARGALYDFYYAEKPGEWRLLKGGADGTILSTKVAGGFVGTFLGLFAVGAQP